MASSTQRTWVWVNSRSWWWTGRPDMLQFIGVAKSQTSELLNWTELNWTYKIYVCIWVYVRVYKINKQTTTTTKNVKWLIIPVSYNSNGEKLNPNSSVQFSHSLASNSFWSHESQHSRLPCPSPAPEIYSNSCPSSWWCHPAISSSVVSFSSCPQSLPASGSFPM